MNTLEWKEGSLWLIDQTRLPLEPSLVECRDIQAVAEAIKALRVRGAPAIGLAAAYGTVLGARSLASAGVTGDRFRSALEAAMAVLGSTRPTAVNLFWALDRMQKILSQEAESQPHAIANALLLEADAMLREDEEINRSMGQYGAELIPDGSKILTHCNTGALAAGSYGTALGVIRSAWEQGKRVHVWVDETRPLLQGARLTAWELQQAGIPFTLITDNMAGYFMARGDVDVAMVGADRIVANGDAANKIGTYGAAVLAHAHDIPFYFVAPTSTVDLATASGDLIPIEQRNPDEVTTFAGKRVAPEGIDAANPAFDVTPARFIAAIITERGVVRPPFADGLAAVACRSARPVEPFSTALAGKESV
ncbi:MAG TPA: S-methyl-5-thioribose-1-phosphate isomerase [Chloroflexota bacterium]